VTTLPETGAKVYARLYSYTGTWVYNDYTYTEASTAGTPATLTSPAPGSVLAGSTVTFTWTAGTGATEYDLYLGTERGASNIYSSGHITATSTTVTTLPESGATVYARLYSYINAAWVYNDYTYKAQ
jgi:serine protease